MSYAHRTLSGISYALSTHCPVSPMQYALKHRVSLSSYSRCPVLTSHISPKDLDKAQRTFPDKNYHLWNGTPPAQVGLEFFLLLFLFLFFLEPAYASLLRDVW